jgi:hypothetical protein
LTMLPGRLQHLFVYAQTAPMQLKVVVNAAQRSDFCCGVVTLYWLVCCNRHSAA